MLLYWTWAVVALSMSRAKERAEYCQLRQAALLQRANGHALQLVEKGSSKYKKVKEATNVNQTNKGFLMMVQVIVSTSIQHQHIRCHLIQSPLEKLDKVIQIHSGVTVAVCLLYIFRYFVHLTKGSSQSVYPSTCVTSAQTTDRPSDTLLHLPVSLFDAYEYETTPWH